MSPRPHPTTGGRWACLGGWLLLAATARGALIGDLPDGSQTPPVHRLELLTAAGDRIRPGLHDNEPFSLRQTCGRCHDVDTVSRGWHLRPEQSGWPAGRPSEPWIYWDAATGTQVPLSTQPGPGVFTPEALGLTAWQFTRVFGRQLPAGPDPEPDRADPDDDWEASGSWEAQCLVCHAVEVGTDPAELARLAAAGGFRWAAAAVSDFAWVTPAESPDPLQARQQPAFTVQYDAGRFDPDGRVTVDIQRRVPNDRCLYCHSQAPHGERSAGDVHVRAGLQCVDCHSNGLDHHIVRGYEPEARDVNEPARVRFSCRGCHLGEPGPDGAALAAPRPVHRGLPPIHLERLSCTACHSGPWPQAEGQPVKTARAHALGTHRSNRSPDTLPHLFEPVLAPGPDGKLAPHRVLWPSYWGRRRAEGVAPLPLDRVARACRAVLPPRAALASPSWPDWTADQVQQVLRRLQAEHDGIEAVYVSGGRLWRLQGDSLVGEADPAAAAVRWPLAHDVRPANQALGARGCRDCHDTEAGLLFGRVPGDGPLVRDAAVPVAAFHGLDPGPTTWLARSFRVRGLFKVACVLGCLVVAVALLGAGLRAYVLAMTGSGARRRVREDDPHER